MTSAAGKKSDTTKLGPHVRLSKEVLYLLEADEQNARERPMGKRRLVLSRKADLSRTGGSAMMRRISGGEGGVYSSSGKRKKILKPLF